MARAVREQRIPSDLLTLRELGEARPFATEKRLRTLRSTGSITTYRMGRNVRFSLAEFDALIERDTRISA